MPRQFERVFLIAACYQRQFGITVERAIDIAHFAIYARSNRGFGKAGANCSGDIAGSAAGFHFAARTIWQADFEKFGHALPPNASARARQVGIAACRAWALASRKGGMTSIQSHTSPLGTKLAFRHTPGSGPAVVFLPGYMSDMAGGKATAVFDWCAAQGRECLLLDYSGCGESGGDFADGSLSIWGDEVMALIAAKISSERAIVCGSSMGGWLMLLVGLQLTERLTGLVGIAAAPDFSDWGFSDAQKALLRSGETIFEDSEYGYEPMPTHAKFWNDAEQVKLLDGTIALTCPVRLLHGQEDVDVPPEISLGLNAALASEDVQVTLVKGGDHRLSRETDIALLLDTISALAQNSKPVSHETI